MNYLAALSTRLFFTSFLVFGSAQVLEVETVKLTPELRKRLPFLGHLPIHCDISFLEVDMTGLVSEATAKKFLKGAFVHMVLPNPIRQHCLSMLIQDCCQPRPTTVAQDRCFFNGVEQLSVMTCADSCCICVLHY